MLLASQLGSCDLIWNSKTHQNMSSIHEKPSNRNQIQNKIDSTATTENELKFYNCYITMFCLLHFLHKDTNKRTVHYTWIFNMPNCTFIALAYMSHFSDANFLILKFECWSQIRLFLPQSTFWHQYYLQFCIYSRLTITYLFVYNIHFYYKNRNVLGTNASYRPTKSSRVYSSEEYLSVLYLSNKYTWNMKIYNT